MRILQQTNRSRSGASIAQVSFSERGTFGAVSAAEQRGMAVFSPRGIAYSPCEGDNLLLITADGTDVCAGVLNSAQGLMPGELRLASAGGAVIHLKNNGDLLLNGITITKDGRLLEKGGASSDGYTAV